jgi:hypothetical protein
MDSNFLLICDTQHMKYLIEMRRFELKTFNADAMLN